jgi:ketosteroid isomerase-like protein
LRELQRTAPEMSLKLALGGVNIVAIHMRNITSNAVLCASLLAAMLMSPGTAVPADTSGAAAAKPDPLVAMFVWWNAAYKQKDGFTVEAFSHYFTPDAVMRINGKDRSVGLQDLSSHFRDIQARTESVVIELPFLDEFASPSGDRIFTHHFVSAREKGKASRERVMGYAAIRNGKISLINFVSVPDEPASDDVKK